MGKPVHTCLGSLYLIAHVPKESLAQLIVPCTQFVPLYSVSLIYIQYLDLYSGSFVFSISNWLSLRLPVYLHAEQKEFEVVSNCCLILFLYLIGSLHSHVCSPPGVNMGLCLGL